MRALRGRSAGNEPVACWAGPMLVFALLWYGYRAREGEISRMGGGMAKLAARNSQPSLELR